jgi:hypothetical protein
VIGLSTAGALFGLLAWDAARFQRQAWPADVRAAYSLQIEAGLNAPDLEAIEAGKTPNIIFEAQRLGGPSSIVWPRATLQRPGDCLDWPHGRPPDANCTDPDTFAWNRNRLVFSSLPDGSRSIGVHAEPLRAGQLETFGAVYGVTGEIGIGRDVRDASRFTIHVEGRALRDAADLKSEASPGTSERDGECQSVRVVSPAVPLFISLLPGARLRACTFKSKDQRSLTLLNLSYGLLQRNRRASALQCRALLKSAVDATHPTDYAGCLWVNWNAAAAPTAALTLFQSLGRGEWALID